MCCDHTDCCFLVLFVLLFLFCVSPVIELCMKMLNFQLAFYVVRTQIIQPPVDTTVLLGLTASLQCKVSSDPSVPYNIDWYRGDTQSAPITNSQRIGVQADGTLEIQAVRAADVGTYSCMVIHLI